MASSCFSSSAAKLCILPLSVFLLLSSSLSFAFAEAGGPSVYEILPEYGLPSGLLPDCVKSYTLSENDGKFEVELEKTCYINFEYTVYYEKRITGILKYGSITHLKGIQVKRFFLWFDVDEIKVDLPPSSSIYFQVGIINKKLSVDQFNTIHSCSSNALTSLFQLPPAVDDEIPMLLTE